VFEYEVPLDGTMPKLLVEEAQVLNLSKQLTIKVFSQ